MFRFSVIYWYVVLWDMFKNLTTFPELCCKALKHQNLFQVKHYKLEIEDFNVLKF